VLIGDILQTDEMALIDRIFVAVFANYRRTPSVSSINTAWIQAVSKVSGFLILPSAVIALGIIATMYLITGVGTTADHLRWGQIVTVVGWLGAAFVLQARFKKYLRAPPVLSPAELAKDRKVVFWFHATCISIFVVMCVAGYLLHAAGLARLIGF
jgi:hypothetical protein